MKAIFFSVKKYEIDWLTKHNEYEMTLDTTDKSLSIETVNLTRGYEIICVSIVDDVSESVLNKLKLFGVNHICIRATGYDNIDCDTAEKLKIQIYNVPDYGPIAIAEHSLMLMLSLLRNLKTSMNQMALKDFRIDNLIGEELSGKTIGILGTGKTGKALAKLLQGFSPVLFACDLNEDTDWAKTYNVKYVKLEELFKLSDIISIHIPLNKNNYHLINNSIFGLMKNNMILINTARGGIIDTAVLIDCLMNNKIAGAGLDVYEFEKRLFFYDFSKDHFSDDRLLKLLNLKNVIVTPHQAFATKKAINNIFESTIYNINCVNNGLPSKNRVKCQKESLINE